MKWNNLLPTLALFFLLLACTKEENVTTESNPNALTILPLGDSRVEGARPAFESYRYELWKNLKANSWTVDLIGPLEDDAKYPEFMDTPFDNDHAGVGGFTTTDVLDNLDDVLADVAAPDVVLLGIGGNDLLARESVSDVIANIHQIIDILQADNDSVTVFIEQIAPGRSDFMTAEFSSKFAEFNAQVETIKAEQTTAISQIVIVNMAESWQDSYMADEVHYNEAGAKVVADRYYAAMEQYLEQ